MITPQHLQEWEASGVDRSIIDLNVRSLSGTAPYDHLFTSDKIKRLNTGRLPGGVLKRYSHIDAGGWWCSGVDPLNNFEPMENWGCLKPDKPIRSSDGKLIKYEHPLKEETRTFCLRVTREVWRQIAKRNGIELPDLKALPNEEVSAAFWQWVIEKNVPIVITEGAKKAGALMSAGYAAIALPGVNSGYRTPQDAYGNRQAKARHLIPDLDPFTGGGREIYTCFDQDTKPKTIKGVNQAIATLGELLTKAGCSVKVVTWDAKLGKGVDDLIVNHGREALDKAYAQALPLASWQRKQHAALTYLPSLRVNRRYLGSLPIPESEKLVCLKAPKGTGKTETIAEVVAEAISAGQPVLVLTHRVQLGEALCNRFGVPYVTEIKESEYGQLLGYGLCVDSLHPNSQARFNAENWDDALVILDEAEQVIWHMLNAKTEVKRHRVSILRQFKQLIINTITGGGRVILSDADLTDVSIDYIKRLAGVDIYPWIAVNDWKPEKGWQVYNYHDPNPAGLVAALEDDIVAGGRPLILCSGQKIKSKYGTQTLEARFQQKFPDKKGLRIDSESISDPTHPAYGCIANLNEVLKNYDYVIASPSIETGVSIDIRGHFTSVWAIAQGNLAVSSVLQQLARLREEVPRHIWAATFGGSLIGNGSPNFQALLASQDKLFKLNRKLLQDTDLDFDTIDSNFDPTSLLTWAYMGARINAGKIKYREAILEGLRDEGHHIVNFTSDPEGSKEMSEILSETRDTNHQAEAIEEAQAPMLTELEAQDLAKKKAKTKAERQAERKYNRHIKYGGVDVTPELILKDDDGWHPKIQLHYYCTVGRSHLKTRDTQRLNTQLKAGNMALWRPDFNKSQLTPLVLLVEGLNILNLLTPGREYRKTDDDLEKMAAIAKANAQNIRDAMGVTVRETDSPIAIFQNLLAKLGLKLTYLKREGSDGDRVRVYGYTPPQDGREEIFAAWLERDTSTPSNSDSREWGVDAA